MLQLPEEKIAEIAKNQNKEKILKDIGNLSSGENIASRIDDIIDGSGKNPYDIMNDAGYKNKNVLHNEEYIKTINQILEKEDANKLISQIKEQKECTNKSLGDILESIQKGTVLRGEAITFDNLQKFIPPKEN